MHWWDEDGGYGWGAMGGGWLAGLVVVLVLLLALTAAAAIAVRLLRQPPVTPAVPPARAGRARDLLDERYARGDIDDEEYRRRLQVLEGTG